MTEDHKWMNSIKIADGLVGLFLLGIVLVGGYGWIRAVGRRGMTSTMPGMDPTRYLFGTLITVCIVLGVYILIRDHIVHALSTFPVDLVTQGHDETKEAAHDINQDTDESSRSPTAAMNSSLAHPSPLQFLPEDERRIVEPILESPGLTQVEIRGRSDFSKAKVSQTVSELEDRGLVYREKQGRTYRVYPGELLKDNSPA